MYTFFVPQDMAALVAALGGPSTFAERLTFLQVYSQTLKNIPS